MNMLMPNLFITISKTNSIENENELKETIARNNESRQKVFNSADLWNIQHKRKRAFKRSELMQVGF